MRKEMQVGNHMFKFICDVDEIKTKIEEERNRFEPNYFQSFYTVGYEDGYIEEEAYQKNLDYMLEKLKEMIEDVNIQKYIESAKKKKDGTFHKNRVVERCGCDNTKYITDWHNTWIYNELCVVVYDDLTLSLIYRERVDTPA